MSKNKIEPTEPIEPIELKLDFSLSACSFDIILDIKRKYASVTVYEKQNS